MTEPLPPPFFRIGPERPASPVILSVPHAGRDYGAHLLNAARLRKDVLEVLEDRLVDRLIWRATALGMTAFVARAPRLEIDLNREGNSVFLRARLNVSLPGVDRAIAEELAAAAHGICPYSKAVHGNIEVTTNVI